MKQKSNLDEVFFTSQTVLTERCLSFSNMHVCSKIHNFTLEAMIYKDLTFFVHATVHES